jgi:hypothetical protein
MGVRYYIAVDPNGAELFPSEGVDDAGALVGHPKAP